MSHSLGSRTLPSACRVGGRPSCCEGVGGICSWERNPRSDRNNVHTPDFCYQARDAGEKICFWHLKKQKKALLFTHKGGKEGEISTSCNSIFYWISQWGKSPPFPEGEGWEILEGRLGSPFLEVPKEFPNVTLRAPGWGQGGDWGWAGRAFPTWNSGILPPWHIWNLPNSPEHLQLLPLFHSTAVTNVGGFFTPADKRFNYATGETSIKKKI